jgi:hypothetical protein
MASTSFAPNLFSSRRVSPAEIDTAVPLRLGPTLALGNSQHGLLQSSSCDVFGKPRWAPADDRDWSLPQWPQRCVIKFSGSRHCESDPAVGVLVVDLRPQILAEV